MKKLIFIFLVIALLFPACVDPNSMNVAPPAKNLVADDIKVAPPAKNLVADEIKMVTAEDVFELPKDIAQYSQKRGCRIPQPPQMSIPFNNDALESREFQRRTNDGSPMVTYNVMRASFYKKGQIDWAVLCSQNGRSSILIFKDGSVKNVDEIANESDDDFLQVMEENGKLVFTRLVYPISLDKGHIVRMDENKERLTPPGVYGLEDAFIEKASTVWYYKKGQWKNVPGAD